MKNKHFLNDNGAASLLVALLFSFMLATTSIAYFMGQIYGISVIVPELNPNGMKIEYQSNQNFKDCSADLETLKRTINSVWNYTCNVGMILRTVGMNPQQNSFGYLLIKNIQPDNNGLYDNTYTINNTAVNLFGLHDDYAIVLRYTGGLGHNEVIVGKDGFYVPEYGLNTRMNLGNKQFFPYPDANQMTHPVIRTTYNDKTSRLTMYLDNQKLWDNVEVNTDLNLFNLFDRNYGGVGSFIPNFALEDFNTEGMIISGISGQGGLSEIAGFLLVIWKIATFSLPAEVAFPSQISFIFDILIVGIFVCIAVIWRGSA